MNTLEKRGFSTRSVGIPSDNLELEAKLVIPSDPKGLVIFTHGTKSSVQNPGDKIIARALHLADFATLQVDLLSRSEARQSEHTFDLLQLAERLTAVTDWAAHDERTEHLPIGYFAAGVGAAAALMAATYASDTVTALVVCEGRVDLALKSVNTLTTPVLFIVSERDYSTRETNKDVFLKLRGKKKFLILPTSSHLFATPSILQLAADSASQWYTKYVGVPHVQF